MRSKAVLLITVAVALLAALANAQEKFGVKVYPGAKEVPSAEKALADLMHITGSCYRTNDSLPKVTAFYKQQPGLKLASQTDVVAEFNGKGVRVEIASPWVDPSDMSRNTDTSIIIEKQ